MIHRPSLLVIPSNTPVMARIARVIAEGVPHHVTQRGNRRQRTFFRNEDYEAYLDLVAAWCAT